MGFGGVQPHARDVQRRPGGFSGQVRMGLIAARESLMRGRDGWSRPRTQHKPQVSDRQQLSVRKGAQHDARFWDSGPPSTTGSPISQTVEHAAFVPYHFRPGATFARPE